MKRQTNGTMVLVRLGEVSLRHPETMTPRGWPDEITKEPRQIRKRSVRRPVAAFEETRAQIESLTLGSVKPLFAGQISCFCAGC